MKSYRVLDRKEDPFLWGYYQRLFYRPSCKQCRFACSYRVTDITLADAWGMEDIDPQFQPLSGVSMVIPNSNIGDAILSEIDIISNWRKMPYEWALNNNEQLRLPTSFHPNRNKFFKLYKKTSFSNAIDASKKISIYSKFLNKVDRGIKVIR